jgi:aldehyde:ferredoxin oxidoreductase
MAGKVQITINDKVVTVQEDIYLLQAIRESGFDVPTLCFHEDLAPSGGCRLCTCEIEQRGKRKMVTACNFPVRGDLKVWTDSDRAGRNRKMLADMYLSRWPNVEVIKEVAARCGVTEPRLGSKYVDENPNACILCERCVSACSEFTQEHILAFAGRGIKRHMTMPFNRVDEHCISCTSCAYVCPTGAIKVVDDMNHPVDGVKIRNAGMKVNAEMARLDGAQCRMREVGTANIVDVMNEYDLLPVMNYKFGQHEDVTEIDSKILKAKYFTQGSTDGCWPGCSMACAKGVDGFELKTGPYKGDKVIVDGPEYETAAAAANMGCFDGDFLVEFNFYCDTYGIDTISAGTCMAFVMEAFEAGQITTEHTGGMVLNFGATDEVLECLHQMGRGKGFGVDVGQGIRWLKNKWISEYGADHDFLWDIGMEVKGLEYSEYVCKESLAQQCGYTMATKGPQHDEAWLIFMDMVNKQLPTAEDKAEACYYYPLWRTWFGLLGLCKLCWNDVVPTDNYLEKEPAKISGHVRGYFDFFEGMTGVKMDELTMLDQSARVYNLQRVMSRMLGVGTRKDDMPPYRAVGPVTVEEYESRQERYDGQLQELLSYDTAGKSTEEKMKVLREYRESQYVQTMEIVYKRRGWTQNGVPKISRLEELGIARPELLDIIRGDQE